MRILIADDSAEAREVLREALEEVSSDIVECESGEEALRLFAIMHPDLVLMDIRMPGKGGLWAIERIHASDPEAHIIVVSQFSQQRYRRAALESGAEQFFPKDRLIDLLDYITERGAGAFC